MAKKSGKAPVFLFKGWWGLTCFSRIISDDLLLTDFVCQGGQEVIDASMDDLTCKIMSLVLAVKLDAVYSAYAIKELKQPVYLLEVF